MASALFVFDHKYPIDKEGTVYYSSGFDFDFFDRYYKIFDSFDIFGRPANLVNSTAKPVDLSIFPVNATLVQSNKNLPLAYGRLKKEILKHDCVISRMPSLFGSLAIRICKKFNIPYIVEIVACTYDALANSPSWKRRLMANPAEMIYRNILKDCPYNIYVTKKFLQDKYPSTGKSVACSNVTLPNVDNFVLQKRLEKIKQIDKSRKIILGTTSTLSVDFKGQKYVIQALPKLIKDGYNIEYQLVGDGDGSWLLDIANCYGVKDFVKIIGRLNHNDVFTWLDNLDIYVHPSSQEGLSRAIIEAMSRACPIVACDTGGIHELIEGQYIVPKKDVSAIGDTILNVLKTDMASMSLYNFANSKEYEKSVLYNRRESFYKQFLKESGLC